MTRLEIEMKNKRAQRIAVFSKPWGALCFSHLRFSFEAN